MANLTQADRRKKIGDVIRVASGNFLEQYDFFVYGFYDSYIGRAFFPNEDPIASLMLSFATFGVGFLMRPLGAVILGAYIDRHGRRVGLILSLTVGTLSIAVTPSYAQIGMAAPLIVLVGRLLQGFSAGVELGGVSVYLAELATPGNRGFYTSWQSASQQVAAIVAALIGVALSASVSQADMAAWGWRIPLLIGCSVIPVILWLRRSLAETEAFHQIQNAQCVGSVPHGGAKLESRAHRHGPVDLHHDDVLPEYGLHADVRTGGSSPRGHVRPGCGRVRRLGEFHLVAGRGRHFRPDRALPAAVRNSRAGHRVVVSRHALAVGAPSFAKLLAVVMLYSSFFGLYNGAMIPLLAEMMPPAVRTAAFSLAFSLATAVFGSFTPLVSTWLIKSRTGRRRPFGCPLPPSSALLV